MSMTSTCFSASLISCLIFPKSAGFIASFKLSSFSENCLRDSLTSSTLTSSWLDLASPRRIALTIVASSTTFFVRSDPILPSEALRKSCLTSPMRVNNGSCSVNLCAVILPGTPDMAWRLSLVSIFSICSRFSISLFAYAISSLRGSRAPPRGKGGLTYSGCARSAFTFSRSLVFWDSRRARASSRALTICFEAFVSKLAAFANLMRAFMGSISISSPEALSPM
mmetsp:Transcript_3913/g.8217  ORF Transcript_3913/g.8217 Transcript_3913/m.8217 type:complete len:224 (+) Transcript_3913:56-727(+)